jgi:hypothetical protein
LPTYLRFTQKTEEQFRVEMMAQAERSVRRSEVLNAVALAEGIDISDDEIREQLTLSMDDTNESRKLIRDSMRRPMVKERMAASMRRDRALRLLLETVGGVDFAALEAEAAAQALAVSEAAEDIELADPVAEAVVDVEVEELAEEIAEEVVAEMAEAEAVEGAGEATAEGASDSKARDASGDTA